VALTWLGRGDSGIEEWGDLRSEAVRTRNERTAAICSACRCSPSIWRKAFPNLAARVKIKRPPLLPGLLRRRTGSRGRPLQSPPIPRGAHRGGGPCVQRLGAPAVQP
jgi:hypothetical protein